MESIFDVLVLGGGFAGLSCAAALAEAGAKVLLIEKKPHVGGRAHSFRDPETGDAIDNGQHLLLECYRETRRFLARVDAADNLSLSSKVRVAFAEPSGKKRVLSCPGFLPAPWHLRLGILAFSGLSWADKAGLGRLDSYMRKNLSGAPPAELDRLTVRRWLTSLGQSRAVQERLWDPIALGSLNDDPAVAGAVGFFQVLRESFYRGAGAARPALARAGLSELYAVPAARFIESRGGKIMTRVKIAGLIERGGRVAGAVSESGENFHARAVVSTLPPWDLARVSGVPGGPAEGWRSFASSPIVGINFWLDRPILGREPFLGLIGTDIQWVFNKGRSSSPSGGWRAALVISGARAHLKKSPAELEAMAARDLAACFPEFKKTKILRARVIKEPFATLSPVPGTEALRPKPGLALPGFYLAGDWTATGLPATIESAVASGHIVAAEILKGENR